MSQSDLNLGRVLMVVPCFNESLRWREGYWDELTTLPGLQLLFVDDGSTDDTWELLLQRKRGHGNLILRLPSNVGKAEAIRQGLLEGIDRLPFGVGYLDADGAFPSSEVDRITQVFRQRTLHMATSDAVWASRVKLGGRNIDRKSSRHYSSRVILTFLAWLNRFDIYDSQCGFKLFKCDESFCRVIRQPFETRWFVDLEIYFRWKSIIGADPNVWEEPLLAWRDVAGSKLRGGQFLQVLRDLAYLSGSKVRKIAK